MTKLKVTQDVVKSIVDSGTTRKTKSIQKFSSIQDSTVVGSEIRLARAITTWSQNDAGLWKTTACFVVNDKIDKEFQFEAVAPLAAGKPKEDYPTKRFYVIWRGRWEVMSPQTRVPNYGPGKGISSEWPAEGPYDIIFHNAGIVNAVIRGENYKDWGTLYFSPASFYWESKTLDIVGKRELCLKTKRVQVVTGVKMVNGSAEVTTETVRVLQ